MLGDMLSTAFNVIGFSWVASPACTELETIVMDWLGKLYGLPEAFMSTSGKGGGVIQGTASEAVVVRAGFNEDLAPVKSFLFLSWGGYSYPTDSDLLRVRS